MHLNMIAMACMMLMVLVGGVEAGGRRGRRSPQEQLLFNPDGSIVYVKLGEETGPQGALASVGGSTLLVNGEVTTLSPSLHMGEQQYRLGNTSTQSLTQCSLSPTNPHLAHSIRTTIEEGAKLINYDLSFSNSSTNPLLHNMSALYHGNQWTRVARHQGETILSLAFNYGVLSLMTLSFGVVNLEVELEDAPPGCVGALREEDKMGVVMELLMRDLQPSDDVISLSEEESVCHQVVQSRDGAAFFTYRCCRTEGDGVTILCNIVGKNIWLQIIDYILIATKFVVLFFGPLLAPTGLFSAALDNTRFIIKIKDPLLKTLCAVRGMDKAKVRAQHVVDLRGDVRSFSKCVTQLMTLPTDHVIPVHIERFEIAVDYGKLLTENKVPVGLVRSAARALFSCGFKDISPFSRCCEMDMFSYLKEMKAEVKWIVFWTGLGKLLLVAAIPALFYVRLLFFYSFEYGEIMYRQHIAGLNQLHLPAHEFNMMQYLLPSHPLCITIYCLYITTVMALTYIALTGDMKRIKRIIFTSFTDMNKLSWLKASELICAKSIWPFEKFGVVGCLLAPVYWVVAMPFILLAYIVYCLPLVFLTGRLIKYSLRVLRRAMSTGVSSEKKPVWYRVNEKLRAGARRLEEELLLREMLPEHDEALINMDRPQGSSPRRDVMRGVAVILLVLNVFGIFILATECIGFVAEVLTFTLMGVIVNAASVLKYMTLIILVVMYCYDCYHNVYKKYLKLNKALFGVVKDRMKKQIEEVTSLPAHLQENTGFKACESSEQADYEAPDDLSTTLPMHWQLNDVIMFIDNEDMPRIPRELFEQVCNIRVAGSPGPVYRSLLEASKKFLLIIFFLAFVFIVVLSFGSMYKVSSTNQTLATLAGGFVPFIMRNFMQPATPDIELGTVSFSSKLDEIIQNFQQCWPMYDLPFSTVGGQEEEEAGPGVDGCDKATQTPLTAHVATQTHTLPAAPTSLEAALQTPDIMTSTGHINSLSLDTPATRGQQMTGHINSLSLDIPVTRGQQTTSDQEEDDLSVHTCPPGREMSGRHSSASYQSIYSSLPPTPPPPDTPSYQSIYSSLPPTPPPPDTPSYQSMYTSLPPDPPDTPSEDTPQYKAQYEAAAGQEVDILVILPEGGSSQWCRVWSNMSLYEGQGEDGEEEDREQEDLDMTELKVARV